MTYESWKRAIDAMRERNAQATNSKSGRMSDQDRAVRRPVDYERELAELANIVDPVERLNKGGSILEDAVADRRRVKEMGYEKSIATARAVVNTAAQELADRPWEDDD